MSTIRTGVKSRRLDNVLRYGTLMRLKPTKEVISTGQTSRVTGYQYTESEGHRKGPKGKYDSGGPFFTVRITPHVPMRNVTLNGTFGKVVDQYRGGCHIPLVPPDLGGFSVPSADSSYLDPYGAEAISVVDPTNPNADLGVALGEIVKDRLPVPGIHGWRRRTEVAKAAGSEYLNAVFGWLPLVRDLKDTSQSILDGNTILENYRSASGTLVHREFAFPDITSESEVQISAATKADYGPAAVSGLKLSLVPLTRRRETVVRRWFSGSFTYYADGGQSGITNCLRIGSDAEKLFGLSLTPDLVWELTPWSWAIDWFSNAGSVIHNATSLGLAGLVMKYGYMMEETTTIDTYSMPGTGITELSGTIPPAKITYCVKRRREANPFGFGVKWDGLSPTQLAITAALGLTRLR